MVDARKAIEKMYIGRCTITEHRQQVDEDTKQTKFVDVDLFSDIPCRLSFSTLKSTSDETVAAVSQTTKLFLAPEINVPAGCKITVTQNSRTTEYKQSGEPSMYSSHQEIQLQLFQRWA